MPSNLYNPDGTRTELRINARSRRTKHMGGEPRGGLFNQPTKSEQVAISERARARRDAAAAAAAATRSAEPAAASAVASSVKKPDGMLVPGRSGGAVWKTKAELDEQRKTKEMADARRRAGANTGGGMFGTVMRGVKKGFDAANQLRKTQDRNYARSRVASEKKYGPITGADSAMFRERARKSGVLDKADPETERVLNS